MAHWHYQREGREHGPLSADRLKALADDGTLLPTDLVRKDSQDRWVAAVKVKGLFETPDTRVLKPTAPSSPTLCFERGNTHLEQNRLDQAIAEYTAALKLDPEWGWAYYKRAEAYRKKDDIDRCLADCDEAIRHDPTLALAFKERGNAHFDRARFDDALTDYDRALQLDPSLMIVHFNRGLVYFQKHEYAFAVGEFSRAIDMNPEYAPAWGYRSLAHLKMGALEEAKEDCAAAKRLDPKFDL